MDSKQVISSTDKKFSDAVERFKSEIKSLRTGRASSAMLDGIMVEAYGSMMPLNQVATVAVVDAQLIQATPFDPNNLESISAGIRNNPTLGLNPSDDGRVVRVAIPPLTEERRRELAKQINEKLEECLVRVRSARHEGLDEVNSLKKDKQLGEDEAKRLDKQIEEMMNKHRASLDAAAKEKEKEILSI